MIDKYCKILEENGIEFRLSDYGRTLAAKGKKDWVYIIRTYRPERDGYAGWKGIQEEDFMQWVEDNK